MVAIEVILAAIHHAVPLVAEHLGVVADASPIDRQELRVSPSILGPFTDDTHRRSSEVCTGHFEPPPTWCMMYSPEHLTDLPQEVAVPLSGLNKYDLLLMLVYEILVGAQLPNLSGFIRYL